MTLKPGFGFLVRRAMANKGKVYLIGAGPGDPGLLTLRGKEILERADVIVYDYLVNPLLLRYGKEDAEVHYVGKKAGRKEATQREINALLVECAGQGKTVARLKGGDPFVFGRGGEEAQALKKEKVLFEVVPGVTSAISVPAYGGIPLTHRDYTSSFAVVTGHENPKKKETSIPWKALSRIGTVVFLMGVRNLSENMKKLIKAGRDKKTPAAVITWGTYSSQKTVTGTVSDIAKKVKKSNDAGAPGIAVVGEVIKLREIAEWFERKPLFTKRVLVTRPKDQALGFSSLLESEGAEVVLYPTIEITPPSSYRTLDRAIKNIRDYDWVLFTSVNGVQRFLQRLRNKGKDLRELYGIKIGAIGAKTAKQLEHAGISVDEVPSDFRAEGLIEIFSGTDVKGKKFLIPRAKAARTILPDTLRNMGAQVDVAPAYETVAPEKNERDAVKRLLKDGKIDVITFTSSSTAKNFFEQIGSIPRDTVIASIGPITAKTVKELGYDTEIMPDKYTVEDLTQAISDYFSNS